MGKTESMESTPITHTDGGTDRQAKMLRPDINERTTVEKVIFERRSVRWYKTDQVPEHLVRRILEAGRFAPSAGNSQPWKFIVIRDRAIINEMERDIQRVCKIFRFLLDWRRPGIIGKIAWVFSQIFIRI